MKGKDLAIGVLSVTATILFVGLLVVNFVRPEPAYAIGQNGRGGDYAVATAQLDMTAELLYVADAGAERLNIYGFDLNMGRIELVKSMDLRLRPPPGP